MRVTQRPLGPKTIDAIPGKEYDYGFQLSTTVGYTVDYTVSVSGPLSKFITPDKTLFEEVAPGESPSVHIKVKFPENYDYSSLSSGIVENSIEFAEATGSGGTIGTRTAIRFLIRARVFSEGKDPRFTFSAEDINVGEMEKFNIDVANWGKEDIDNIQGKIDIYQEDRYITSVYTDPSEVKGWGGSASLNAFWDTSNNKQGEYWAKATISWDGNSTILNDTFLIGDLDIELINYTDTFEKDKISPMHINVKSNWGNDIRQAYFTLASPEANIEVKSPTEKIPAWGSAELSGYINTNGLSVGSYPGKLTLFFDGRSKDKNIDFRIVDDISKENKNASKAELEKPKESGSSALLTILIILLIIINLIWLVVFIYRKKENNKYEE